MAAKCNITGLALQELNSLIWGIDCDLAKVQRSILRNYIEYLDCPNIEVPDECDMDTDCINNTIITSCENFKVNSITAFYPDRSLISIVLSLQPTDYVGANLPLSYAWEYNTDDFDISGDTVSPELALILKEDRAFFNLISAITVTVTDALGCVATKTCYITPEGMECADDFAVCPNPTNLEVLLDAP